MEAAEEVEGDSDMRAASDAVCVSVVAAGWTWRSTRCRGCLWVSRVERSAVLPPGSSMSTEVSKTGAAVAGMGADLYSAQTESGRRKVLPTNYRLQLEL